jgi:hypothetical protein
MADLLVEAQRSAGLENYGIAVDGIPVTMVADTGIAPVVGECGDESVHGVVYGFDGPAGETLGFTIKCGETIVYAVAGAQVAAGQAPAGGGGGDFQI